MGYPMVGTADPRAARLWVSHSERGATLSVRTAHYGSHRHGMPPIRMDTHFPVLCCTWETGGIIFAAM